VLATLSVVGECLAWKRSTSLAVKQRSEEACPARAACPWRCSQAVTSLLGLGWRWDRYGLDFSSSSKVVTLLCGGICGVEALRLRFRMVFKVIYVIESRCLFCHVCVVFWVFLLCFVLFLKFHC